MKAAFTLIETLIGIALLAIIATFSVIVINPSSRIADAQSTANVSNSSEILKAFKLYFTDNFGEYPLTDSGNPTQIETLDWIQTEMIDQNNCSKGQSLSEFESALTGDYIIKQAFDGFKDDFQVVFTTEASIFICFVDTSEYLYVLN